MVKVECGHPQVWGYKYFLGGFLFLDYGSGARRVSYEAFLASLIDVCAVGSALLCWPR